MTKNMASTNERWNMGRFYSCDLEFCDTKLFSLMVRHLARKTKTPRGKINGGSGREFVSYQKLISQN